MKLIKHSVLICSLLLLFGVTANAQRTSDFSFFVGLQGRVSAYSIPSGGLDINFGQYMFDSYWYGEVSAVNYNQKVNYEDKSITGTYFDHSHICAKGGWMYRVYGNYDRSINLYMGGGFLLGANINQTFRKLPEEVKYNPATKFIYGVEPRIQAEFFVIKKLAVTVGVESPLSFGSGLAKDMWHLTASVGLRYNL